MFRRLHIIESNSSQYRKLKIRIINTYENLIVRLYCLIRFLIIPLRMMESIGQFVPERGCVLDLGCGFGLFTLYFAVTHPNSEFIGIDRSASRIQTARNSARKLGLSNVQFIHGDAQTAVADLENGFQLVFSIDLFHHLTTRDGDQLAQRIFQSLLNQNGIWILKDVTTRPRLMLYFTYLLDLIMNPRDSFYYRNISAWTEYSRKLGYASVEAHEMWDVLPYPHFILIARKGQSSVL